MTAHAVGEGTRVPLLSIAPLPLGAFEHVGRRRVRARLVPDADRGWADPDARSVWPGAVETDWAEVEIIRN